MRTAFHSFFRNFKKRKIIYSITIGGFAISMAVFFFIVAFIIDENKVDKNIADIERVYHTEFRWKLREDSQNLINSIKNGVPEIEKTSIYNSNSKLFKYGNEKKGAKYLSVNDSFFDIFPVKIKSGRLWKSDKKNKVVVTEELAENLFKSGDPIGKIIYVNDSIPIEVIGVINNPGKYSSLTYDMLMPIDNNFVSSIGFNARQGKIAVLSSAFCIANKRQIDIVKNKLPEVTKGFKLLDSKIIPYQDLYFSKTRWNHKNANVKMIHLLSWIALIVLILAILNYINLSTASNLERFKEVCIKKTSGATNASIVKQFITESYIVCFISLLLSIFFIVILSPVFNTILNSNFKALYSIITPEMLAVFLAGLLVLGSLTGFIPALTVSFFNPVQLVQNNKQKHRFGMRGVFNMFQFVVTIVLIVCLILINKQISYAKSKNYGFDKELLLSIRTKGKAKKSIKSLTNELNKYSGISNVTASVGIPLEINWCTTEEKNVDGEIIEYNVDEIFIQSNFLETFKIKLIQGRDIKKEEKYTCLINERFYKDLGFTDLEERYLGNYKIVGVVKDFHYSKIHQKISNLALLYGNKHYAKMNYITVRINNDNISQHLSYIKSIVKDFDPLVELDYTFYDDRIENMYQKEERQAEAIRFYAIIAILISCLGLYGMVEFASKKRIKEIGVRKVNGAKTREIIYQLNKDFTIWVVIAFILACPLALYVMNKWLENFAYKTPMSWWIFALAGISVLFIALITVSWQSWRTASKNPVEALRYE